MGEDEVGEGEREGEASVSRLEVRSQEMPPWVVYCSCGAGDFKMRFISHSAHLLNYASSQGSVR